MLGIIVSAGIDLFSKMELAQFFGCQGHVARQQFIGVERPAFAVIPAYAMGDNGPHNRWTFQPIPTTNSIYVAPTNPSFARGMGLMGALEDTMSSRDICKPVTNIWQYRTPTSGHWSSSNGENVQLPGKTVTSSYWSPSSRDVIPATVPTDVYSRKVFVGGLPPDIDDDEIKNYFERFGPLTVDWPHKAQTKAYFPPKGYAFLLFATESSVHKLIKSCLLQGDKLYLFVSSLTHQDKKVQIRPWTLSDSDYVKDGAYPLDPRKTIFVGGVPRPLKASELAEIMNSKFGSVCYAGIDTDPELKYPKGAGRVTFYSQSSYISAVSARFVQLTYADVDKKQVEIKPYVLDDQMCDECHGVQCGGKYAPFFCGNINCLQYYCEHCWATVHAMPAKFSHRPLVKEGGDRPRSSSSRQNRVFF